MHEKILDFVYLNKELFLNFQRKTSIFNIRSVSYSVNLQPEY